MKIFILLKLLLLLLPALLQTGCSSPGEGADPGVTDFPVAFVKRTINLDNVGIAVQPDIREPLDFAVGGDVYIKERASAGATETNITQTLTAGLGDVRDINPSFDGTKILFSLKLEDPDPNDNVFFTWNIYEYDLTSKELRRIIDTDILAEEGDDISPVYLPDGRIVFSSSRQTQSRAILLDEGVNGLSKPQFSSLEEDRRTKSLVLHIMNADGSNIHQITFNQSHDLDPAVLSDGRILFNRWDNAGNNSTFDLYTVNPDGTNLQHYYGFHDASHLDNDGNVIELTQPEELADGRILALAKPVTDTFGGGDLVIIDAINYVDNDQPVSANIGVLSGPAQIDATVTNVVNNDTISAAGRYHSAYPLRDGSNRLLVSKGICQLEINNEIQPCIEPWLSDTDAVELTPNYGIWIYDLSNDTEKPLVLAEQGVIISQAVSIQPTNLASIILDKDASELDATLADAGLGALHIRSVYDFGDNTFTGCFLNNCTSATDITTIEEFMDPALLSSDQRPARFLRLVKAVGIPERNDERLSNPPNPDNAAFGPNRRLGMREIIGYGNIEPDGSVKLAVPANVAFSIEVLDKFARRLGPRHDVWLQVEPGETLECNGCHTHATNEAPLPHGRNDAINASINPGAAIDGYEFPNTQVPGTSSAYFGDFGDTMAEARLRQASASLMPSVNIIFDDIWSDPAATTIDASFSYSYSGVDGLTTPIPTSNACDTSWTGSCRIVINYVEHIAPLWSLDRGANTCTSCHSTKDENDVTRIPLAQLDLTGDISDEDIDHIESYEELLSADNGQELDAMGNLIDSFIIVPVLDENGDPVLDINGNPVTEQIIDPNAQTAPSMTFNGARSSYFMEKLTETEIDANRNLEPASVDHSTFLSAAELRLISEWLDMGAQYYNNPFDPAVPTN